MLNGTVVFSIIIIFSYKIRCLAFLVFVFAGSSFVGLLCFVISSSTSIIADLIVSRSLTIDFFGFFFVFVDARWDVSNSTNG